jgi:hypothetical protein
MLDINKILNDLSSIRPVFHSEADFQHALAWEIQKRCPKAQIRLEINLPGFDKKEYIDIWIKIGNKVYIIELKYKTKKIDLEYNKEKFYLLNQGAQDVGRYDFIKDITRLERFISKHKNYTGYAIMLTNDNLYWRDPVRLNTVDANFRIHENRKIKGKLEWDDRASAGTKRGRESNLIIKDSYLVKWSDYSILKESGPNYFRSLLFEIKK